MLFEKEETRQEEPSSTTTPKQGDESMASSAESSHTATTTTKTPDTEWPEDGMTLGLWNAYQRWTYSYINPLLNKGSRQKKENFRLDQGDLYKVPHSMSSTLLNDHFR